MTQSYDNVFGDAVHDIPPELLAELLHEELLFQSQQGEFQEVSTGGALSSIFLSESNHTQNHCLIYPSDPGLQTLSILSFLWGSFVTDSSVGDLCRLHLHFFPLSFFSFFNSKWFPLIFPNCILARLPQGGAAITRIGPSAAEVPS